MTCLTEERQNGHLPARFRPADEPELAGMAARTSAECPPDLPWSTPWQILPWGSIRKVLRLAIVIAAKVAQRAVGLHHLVIRVGQQPEGQPFLGAELLVAVRSSPRSRPGSPRSWPRTAPGRAGSCAPRWCSPGSCPWDRSRAPPTCRGSSPAKSGSHPAREA